MYSLPIFAGSYLNLGILIEHCDEVAVNSETEDLPLRNDKLLGKLRQELLGEMLVHSDSVRVENVKVWIHYCDPKTTTVSLK